MPQKVRDLVTSALRRIGYLDPDERPTPTDARVALVALNGLLHRLETAGLAYQHVALGLDSLFPFGVAAAVGASTPRQIDERHFEGLAAMLGLRLTDDFAPEADTPVLRRDASYGRAALGGALRVDAGARSDLPGVRVIEPEEEG